MKLNIAAAADFRTLLSWFSTQQELTLWGGPGLPYPMDADQFQALVETPESHSRVLKGDDDELLAFGQFSIRSGRHHFGRLAVSPAIRGRGLGKALISHLLDESRQVQLAKGASLFVYQDNLPAIRCYSAMGFAIAPFPGPEEDNVADCLYMVRP